MRTIRIVVLPLVCAAASWFAVTSCRSTQGPGAESGAGPGPHVVVASPAASAQSSAVESAPQDSSQAPSANANPPADGGFSCAPTEPIKSTDPCKSSTDCAPSALCHAPLCIDKLKAPVPPDGGAVCTKSLMCRTTDVGRCDCVDGVCALVAN